MVKKRDNTRNARQGLVLEPEVRQLAELPRAEKTDLTNVFIRTAAAKNSALLDAKILKKKKNKKNGKRLNKRDLENKLANSVNLIDKERLERALKFTNKLDGKIAKSVSRAKYVQSARKAGWESTNAAIKLELNGETTTKDKEMDIDDDIEDDLENDESNKKPSMSNIFSLLPEEVDL